MSQFTKLTGKYTLIGATINLFGISLFFATPYPNHTTLTENRNTEAIDKLNPLS